MSDQWVPPQVLRYYGLPEDANEIGGDRTPIEAGDVAVLPVRFAHVDLRTGVTLAEFGSAEEAQDALRLIGPLADVEIDAIFAPEIPEGGASGLAVSAPPSGVVVPPGRETRPWDVDTETARALDARYDDEPGSTSGSDW